MAQWKRAGLATLRSVVRGDLWDDYFGSVSMVVGRMFRELLKYVRIDGFCHSFFEITIATSEKLFSLLEMQTMLTDYPQFL